jgi:hypothetical protein
MRGDQAFLGNSNIQYSLAATMVDHHFETLQVFETGDFLIQ